MSRPTRCRIWYDIRGSFYRVVTPYNPAFMLLFKSQIPGDLRKPEYNTDGTFNCWIVDERYGQAIHQVCLKIFGTTDVQFVGKETAIKDAEAKASGAGSANVAHASQLAPIKDVWLQFCQVLPYNAAKRAYLVAATELHPDKNNGDASKMSLLNLTWKRIESEVYKK